MSDYPMLISNKLHSFRNFTLRIYKIKGDTIGCLLLFCLFQGILNYTFARFS